MLRLARRTDHNSATVARQLDGGGSHPAGGTCYQQRLTGPEVNVIEDARRRLNDDR